MVVAEMMEMSELVSARSDSQETLGFCVAAGACQSRN
jgi:hypothetical protein